jgi:hypothetical protein
MDGKKYIESQARAARPITNDELVCKDCIYRGGKNMPTGHCDVYRKDVTRKPNKVLLGGDCEYHTRA